MDTGRIGMLVRVDACLGCQACQVACREENNFPYDELWMEMIRRKPQKVSNQLRKYHVGAPQLDKCTLCHEKDHTPAVRRRVPNEVHHGCPSGKAPCHYGWTRSLELARKRRKL